MYESFSGTPEAHEHQAEAHATCHHHYGASTQSHEQHHRASRPSYVSYLTLKRPGSPTTVGRTPGHHASIMLREASVCAPQAEQVQRVGRSAAPPPHALRRGMTDALPCCSHGVRQRVCAGRLAWQRAKREGEPPHFGLQKALFLMKARLGLWGKRISQEYTLRWHSQVIQTSRQVPWRPSAAVAERPSAAYSSSFDPRMFESFRIRAVETSSQGTAVSLR